MATTGAKARLLSEIEETLEDLVKSVRQASFPAADRRNLAEAAERLANARREIAQS